MNEQHFNSKQFSCTSPMVSAWVSASAGTGKTRALSNRVLRLLLSRVRGDRILCITFTNAAALEIESRIMDILNEWQFLSDDELRGVLYHLTHENPSDDLLNLAKSLFITNLKFPLRIHTIHGFAQMVLSKFPDEVGIQNGSRVIDALESGHILRSIIATILKDICDEQLGLLLEYVPLFSLEARLIEALDVIRSGVFLDYEFAIDYISFDNFQLNVKYLFRDLLTCGDLPVEVMRFCQISNEKNYMVLRNLCLTKSGEMRKRMVTKKIQESNASLATALFELQMLCTAYEESIVCANIKRGSEILENVAKHLMQQYDNFKLEIGVLDYTDLIVKCSALLSQSDLRHWVLYKMDSIIEHLLLDEAQDTSPMQWEIIESITEDFFAGDSAYEGEMPRTIFVVGDKKQSIYSFQGAAPKLFDDMRLKYKFLIESSGQKFVDIDLDITYRLPAAVLDLAQNIFGDIEGFDYNKDIVTNRQDVGAVELCQIERKNSQELSNDEQGSWLHHVVNDSDEECEADIIADNIARIVKEKLESGVVLGSKGGHIAPSDIMILLRRRTDLMFKISEALNKLAIANSGEDKLNMHKNIAVVDLMNIIRFVYSPLDDVNLISILKMPYFHFFVHDVVRDEASYLKIEEYILEVCSIKGDMSIIDFLYARSSDVDVSILDCLSSIQILLSSLSIIRFMQKVIDQYGIRQYYIERNRFDIVDTLDEFLMLICDKVSKYHYNLPEIIDFCESSIMKMEINAKRSATSAKGVRIMTVHGAKGLEAPVVIVADAHCFRSNISSIISINNKLLSTYNFSSAKQVSDIKNILKTEEYSEYMRLLYVAITRAQDILIFVGIKEPSGSVETWINYVEKNLT